jgi:hypothetical protein
VFVRDLEATGELYSRTLGFTVYPGATFPDGARSKGVLLEEGYLELLSVTPLEAKGKAVDRARFLQSHQGAVFLALEVSSAATAAEFLRSRGFEVTTESSEFFRTVHFVEPVLAAETFLIEYTRKTPCGAENQARAQPDPYRAHPNTAKRLAAVWIAVHDADAAARAFNSIGLQAIRKLEVHSMGGKGWEIRAGQGRILLLQPDGRDSSVASFLQERGEAIMGASLEVANLETAAGFANAAANRKLPPYQGAYGSSILVPGELTHGLWIEMFQRESASSE